MLLVKAHTSPWHHVTTSPGHHFLVPTAQRLDLGDVRVCVRDSGVGQRCVVLIHGWLLDGVTTFASAFSALADQGWRVVSVDLPGHGGTRDAESFSLLRGADIVIRVLDELGIDEAAFVGYSMGGPVTQLVAKSYPGRVSALVQVATAACITTGLERGGLKTAARVLEVGARANVLPVRWWRSIASTHTEHGNLVRHASWLAVGGDPHAWLRAAGQLCDFDSRLWVGSLDVPAASVVTVRDHAVAVAAQEELCRLLGAERFEVAHGHSACLHADFGQTLVRACRAVDVSCENK